jgi:GNAT superfamily N-acetyltransferase
MSLTIRTMTSNDVAAADAVAVAAYDSPVSRGAELRRYLRLQQDGWFLALDEDGRAVGLGGVVNYGAFAYIGLVGVLPAAQRRGVGQAIMEHILLWLRAKAIAVALLDASPAGEPLYRRLGFVADDQSDVWQREQPLSPLSPGRPLRASVTPVQPEDVPELVAFDRPRFGADRGNVLAALLAEFPGCACATRGASGQLTGFLFTQPNKLGPWVAATPAVAEQLLQYALTLPFAAGPTVLVPGANAAAAALLQQTGFVKRRSLQHMRLGGEHPCPRRQTYGLSSFALG